MKARSVSNCRRIGLIVISLVFSLIILHKWCLPDEERTLLSNSLYGTANPVYNRTLGFEKIFVISRPDRTDRRDAMTLGAAVTGFDFELVDGIEGSKVPDKAIPNTSNNARLKDGVIGCWRAHMNVMQEIIRRGMSSALVLEDDADWSIELKDQLVNFSRSARTLLSLDTMYTATIPTPNRPEIYLDEVQYTKPNLITKINSELSPYGGAWDLLWLGHSEMHFIPPASTVPNHLILHTDRTVPQSHYLKSVVGPYTDLQTYLNHTRITHHAYFGVGTIGYAVTQAGARRILHHVGLKDVSLPVDNALRAFCDGTDGRGPHVCVGVQPGIFEQWRPRGRRGSDIQSYEGNWLETGYSYNLRRSVQLNMEVLLEGKGQLRDQYPDVD